MFSRQCSIGTIGLAFVLSRTISNGIEISSTKSRSKTLEMGEWRHFRRILYKSASIGRCATYIGYQPGDIPLYSVLLPRVCPLGSAIHELGHVIGFYHEMSRVDRDREISIFFNRMSLFDSAQYDIMQDPQPGYYGQPYDLGSIMHYRSTVRNECIFSDVTNDSSRVWWSLAMNNGHSWWVNASVCRFSILN